ncbi:MAG: hypothetical protein AAB408_01015 [Patescibacteria group bacterium]
MLGSKKSGLFAQKLIPRTERPLMTLANDLLSIGSVSYYFAGSIGGASDRWQTKIFLHNYFPLLADALFPAEWEVRLYGAEGQLLWCQSGEMTGAPATVVLDTATIPGLDTYGVVFVHIKGHPKEMVFKEQYASVFFTEYYVPGTQKKILAHSLGGSLKATHYAYHATSTSWVTPPGFRPYLFLANGCDFQDWCHPRCAQARVTFINDKKQKAVITVPPFGKRACQQIDLFAREPKLQAHLGDRPYQIEVDGDNILPKPYLFETNGTHVFAEHL